MQTQDINGPTAGECLATSSNLRYLYLTMSIPRPVYDYQRTVSKWKRLRSEAKETRRAEIIKMVDEAGLSFTEVGRLYNLTRQRVHQIYWNLER